MKYQRNEQFELKEVAGDHLLIARGSAAIDFSAIVIFNETGVFLWQHLDTPQTADALAALLVERFQAPKEVALVDVNTFLNKMLGENLIHCEEN